MRSFIVWILSPVVGTALFWTVFSACVDSPVPPAKPQARLVTTWDPLQCGDPHRVVLELEDDAGVPLSVSTPCVLGSLAVDIPHFGIYRGRVYAWIAGEPERASTVLEVPVDEPVVRLQLMPPP
jgi:hypothetical protein